VACSGQQTPGHDGRTSRVSSRRWRPGVLSVFEPAPCFWCSRTSGPPSAWPSLRGRWRQPPWMTTSATTTTVMTTCCRCLRRYQNALRDSLQQQQVGPNSFRIRQIRALFILQGAAVICNCLFWLCRRSVQRPKFLFPWSQRPEARFAFFISLKISEILGEYRRCCIEFAFRTCFFSEILRKSQRNKKCETRLGPV